MTDLYYVIDRKLAVWNRLSIDLEPNFAGFAHGEACRQTFSAEEAMRFMDRRPECFAVHVDVFGEIGNQRRMNGAVWAANTTYNWGVLEANRLRMPGEERHDA